MLQYNITKITELGTLETLPQELDCSGRNDADKSLQQIISCTDGMMYILFYSTGFYEWSL
jgi:hypothetical protein